MSRGIETPEAIRKLIVRLRDEEKWSYAAIGQHVDLPKMTVLHVYKNQKCGKERKLAGRKRKTDIRYSILSLFNSKKHIKEPTERSSANHSKIQS